MPIRAPSLAFFLASLLALPALPARAEEPLARRMEREISAAAEKVRAAVVIVEAVMGTPTLVDEGEGDEKAPKGREVPSGSGSGVLISPDGWILTNFHVAGQATSIEIGLPGGRKLAGRRCGVDPVGDLCMIKVDSDKPLPYAELGDSGALKVGQWAFAMGNPFMSAQTTYEPTITFGIVSGLRRFNAEGQFIYANAIQMDAAINPGNSGGPLFDLDGRLIGINGKGQLRRGRVYSGIGYAIPVDTIKGYLEDLKAGKTIQHGFAGLEAADDLERKGVRVKTVGPGSPAEKAGLKQNDLVTEAGGRPVRDAAELYNVLAPCTAGQTLKLKALRGAAPVEIDLVLGQPPQRQQKPPRPQGTNPGQKPPATPPVKDGEKEKPK